MNIKPLADRVVVKPVEVEETTSSGIILAASRTGEAPRSLRSLQWVPADSLTARKLRCTSRSATES